MKNDKTLLFGIGNSGREDDGLGWAFLDKVKPQLPENFDIEYRYQLQVEDAELATQYQNVIFIDAHKQVFKRGFVWDACLSKPTDSFTSHELDPETIMYLSESIYNKKPNAHILGISGEKFNLQIGLTKSGNKNLTKALDFFTKEVI